MMEVLEQETLKIDKSSWTPVKFGDVVFEPKENAKDIYNEDIEHVVGLEHIDSENIHLTRSGQLEETTTFSKKFAVGDVLFGRRRAYLKKAAQATFSGICSGDITVFRAKDNLMVELLPFIVCNDKFFDYAVKHSAGGLSPRVKFKDLANFEFLLPPKDQQARLAELLWAMDEVIERELKLEKNTIELFEASRNDSFDVSAQGSDCHETRIGSLMSEKMLNGIYKSKEFHGSGVRLINMGELFAFPVIHNQEMALIELNEKEKGQFLVQEGDLMFARRSLVIEGAGKCAIIGAHNSPMTFESSMIRVRVDENIILSKYIYHFLKSKEGRRRIRRIVGFTTVAGIASSDLGQVKVPIFDLEKQNDIVNNLDQYDNIFKEQKRKIESSKSLQKSLINQIF